MSKATKKKKASRVNSGLRYTAKERAIAVACYLKGGTRLAMCKTGASHRSILLWVRAAGHDTSGPPGPPDPIPGIDGDAARALCRKYGGTTAAARALGCTFSTLWRRAWGGSRITARGPR